MTDKEIRAFIRNRLEFWTNLLRVNNYVKTVTIRKKSCNKAYSDYLARVITDSDNQTADYVFYVNNLVSKSRKEIDDTVCHEVCHTFLSPVRDYVDEISNVLKQLGADKDIADEFRKRDEATTRRLTNILMEITGR